MNNRSRDDAEFRRRVRKPAEWRFKTVWCGTANCGQMFSIQMDAKSGYMVSAACYERPGAMKQTIVTHCIKCGAYLDEHWLAETLSAAPAPKVYGMNHDDNEMIL